MFFALAETPLLIKYSNAFASSSCEIGLFPVQARIPTLDKEVAQPQHPVAQRHRPLVDGEIKSMLAQGVIEPCNNPLGFNSPIFIVDKADGSPRVVVNFKRTLNTTPQTNI